MKHLSSLTLTGAILMIVLAVVFGAMARPTEMALIIVACAIGIAFVNLERIQRFKGAGFEAEMRQAVEQVHATVDQLRLLAAISAEGTLTSLMAENFFDGTTSAERVALHDKLVGCLQSLGVPPNSIDQARRMWKKGIGVIYHRGIRNLVDGRMKSHEANLDAPPEVRKAQNDFQELLRFETWDAPSAEGMKAFLQQRGVMNPEMQALIDDYAYFERTGNLQRQDVFVKL